MTEVELKAKVNEILATKNFTQQAKEYLLQTMILIWKQYEPPKYISTSKEQYISGYLEVLKNMNGCAIVKIEDLNLPIEAMQEFCQCIREVPAGTGNIEVIDNKYIKSNKGSYECFCGGYATPSNQEIFILEEENLVRLFSTFHHEMTHLKQGRYPFLVNSSVPIAFELREMLYEGHAAVHQSYLKLNHSYSQVTEIRDPNATIEIQNEYSYPLYSYLYRTLQLLFKDELLEQLSKNNDNKKDMITILKQNYPKIPVETIFSHIIYILSCYKKVSQDTLRKSFSNYHDTLELWENVQKKIEQEILEREQKLQKIKTREFELKSLLGDFRKLEREYQSEKEDIKKDCEEYYKSGNWSYQEYQQEMQELETYGTLEYYRETREADLETVKTQREEMEIEVSTLRFKLQELIQAKADEVNMLPYLEEVCLKNPSLEQSFGFLEDFVFQYLQSEYANLSLEEKQNDRDIFVSQMEQLALLKCQRKWKDQKKTRIT